MSDVEGDSPMDVLQTRQRKEKKELKEKCLAMKKAAKCGNKQKQKEANAAVEELEKEVEQRHAREMEQLTKQLAESTVCSAPEPQQKDGQEEGETSFYKEATINSKTKKKQAKQAEMAQRLKAAIAEDREASLTSLRFIESTSLTKVLQDRGLKLVDIAPDGDCLYNSVAHQLNRAAGFKTQLRDVRRRAARYILEHKDDFSPFLTNDNGDPLDEFEFEKYCGTVESEAKDGGVWGGEPELIALSKSFERKIEVIQPEGRVIVYGEEYSTRPLTIVYQRHAYQLGEHYNSTEPLTLV